MNHDGGSLKRNVDELLDFMDQPHGPSLVPMPFKVRPRRKRLGVYLNDQQAMLRNGDEEGRLLVESRARAELELYVREEVPEEPNPPWAEATARAATASTLDGPEASLPFDEKALEAAVEDWELGLAAHNYSDTARTLGRLDDAVDYATRAVAFDPRNLGRWSNLTLALLRRGDFDEAVRIVEVMMSREDFDEPTNLYRLHGRYEDEYRNYRHIPQVRDFLNRSQEEAKS